MPITECKGYKSTPAALLNYITGKPETTRVEYRDVDPGRPLAQQFRENHKLHGKGLGFDERKYYHLFISWPAGADISDDEVIAVNDKILEKFFPDHPAVCAIHNKDHKHIHSCIDSVSLEKGKMVHMSQSQYQALKDYANELGAELGFENVDYRKPKSDRMTKAEQRVLANGETSWKSQLCDVIVNAYNDTLDAYGTFADFIERCQKENVKLSDEGKWILKGHMPVGYSRLGEQYKPMTLFNNLTENYLNSLPEELREEQREIERKTSLWERIIRAERVKEKKKEEPKQQLTPYQMEQLYEYYAGRDKFWEGYRQAQDLASKELSRAYQSEENKQAYRNYRRAQYLFKNSFGLISLSLSIVALVCAKSDLKKEQRRIEHVKELRKELALLSSKAISIDVARKDAKKRDQLSDELVAELLRQQEEIDKRIEKILSDLTISELKETAKTSKRDDVSLR